MTALAILAALAMASLAVAGLLSDDCRVAIAVATARVRYACGARDAASGLSAAGVAFLACLAAGTAFLLCAAARRTSDFACRAAADVIPG